VHFYADEIFEVIEPGIELPKNIELFFNLCVCDEAAVIGERCPSCNFSGRGNLHFLLILQSKDSD